MSSSDIPDDANRDGETKEEGSHENDSLASKLSQELSNWRRKRTSSRPRRMEGSNGNLSQSEPARTIKVRGHETLVVRKAKLSPKLPANSAPENE